MCIRDSLNISTIKEYLTTPIISSIRSKPAEHCVNNTEVKENVIAAYMSDYVRIEEIQYLLIKKDLNMTENRDLNEDFVSAELQYQIHERYVTRTKIITNFTVIRGKGVPELMDHGLNKKS